MAQAIETRPPVDGGYCETLRALLAESDTEVEIEVSASHLSGTVYVDVAGAGPVALDVDQALLLAAALFGAVRSANGMDSSSGSAAAGLPPRPW